MCSEALDDWLEFLVLIQLLLYDYISNYFVIFELL